MIQAHQAEFAAAVQAQDALAMIATNAAFHSAIAEAGRNPYFTGLFNRLLDEGRRMLRLYYQSYDDRLPQRFVEEHDDIIAVIANRDVEAADRLARLHAEQIVLSDPEIVRPRRQARHGALTLKFLSTNNMQRAIWLQRCRIRRKAARRSLPVRQGQEEFVMTAKIFSGVIPALMTPCKADRTPDFDALVRKGKELIAPGHVGRCLLRLDG